MNPKEFIEKFGPIFEKKDRSAPIYTLTDSCIEHHIAPEEVTDEQFQDIVDLAEDAINNDVILDRIIYEIIQDAVQAVKGGKL